MAKLCNSVGFKVTLGDHEDAFGMLVGKDDIYVSCEGLVDDFPILRERYSRLEKASLNIKDSLRGRCVNLIDGSTEPINHNRLYVRLCDLVRELLYVRYTGKGSEMVANLIYGMVKAPTDGVQACLRENRALRASNAKMSGTDVRRSPVKGSESDTSEETFCKTDQTQLPPETEDEFRSVLRGESLHRVYMPDDADRRILALFGVFKEKLSWTHDTGTPYPVRCMKFAHGYILTRPHFGEVETSLFISNDQLKALIMGIGFDSRDLTTFLNERFANVKMYSRLYTQAREDHVYVELSPERGDGFQRVGLVRYDTVTKVFSDFSDDTCKRLCTVMDIMQSYISTHSTFFETFMGIDDIVACATEFANAQKKKRFNSSTATRTKSAAAIDV